MPEACAALRAEWRGHVVGARDCGEGEGREEDPTETTFASSSTSTRWTCSTS
jgi:hypothetical protein